MNKKLLCTAIGASLAVAAGSANAYRHGDYYNMLVPYVVKDANRTTVVTVIATSDSRDKANQDLHLQYWTKSTTDANTASCLPNSVFVPITPADIMTFDTAGLLGYPLFGDTTNPAPNGTSISYAAPRHGYLLIDDRSDQLAGGFWLELDLANGGAHGDRGLMHWGDTSEYNFINNSPGNNYLNGAFVLAGPDNTSNDSGAPVQFWPSSVATTAFTVTPLGTDMLNRENNQVVVQVMNDGDTPVQGAYDRNENGVDGTVPITVRCVGRVTPAQLMPGVVANAAWAAQGGWGYLMNRGDGDDVTGEFQTGTNSGDVDAVIYQVDTSTASGKFMINATNIATDNGDYAW